MADVVSWISGGAALGSLVVAGMAYRFSRTTRIQAEQRDERLNKRDLFLSLHERLCTPGQIWGRRIIRDQVATLDDARRLRSSNSEEGRAAAGSIGMLNTLGLYVKRGYVDLDLVLAEWGHVLAEVDKQARFVIEASSVNGRLPFPHFQDLATEAVKWVGQHAR
ncbi:hypothetical protein [Streptomyces sp. NPDC002685]|uniref:hypothetical protein n=1 Tax=Streptomyces sp. NPDC002685 TaxID=3154540 RepID=UPI003329F34D